MSSYINYYEPGDGWRYAAIVTQLPENFDGGNPYTHVHVSVTSPIRWSFTFGIDGALHERYVQEKMKMNDLSMDLIKHYSKNMTTFIGDTLGRECVYLSKE